MFRIPPDTLAIYLVGGTCLLATLCSLLLLIILSVKVHRDRAEELRVNRARKELLRREERLAARNDQCRTFNIQELIP